MTDEDAASSVAFKLAGDVPVVVWDGGGIRDEYDRASTFERFPNICTPTELVDVLERLPFPPVQPLWFRDECDDVKNPELLLDVFGMDHTRKNINDMKDLLATSALHRSDGPQSAIPLGDLIVMARDMKALLTVLIYAYGKWPHLVSALEMNTAEDFGFLYEWRGRRSAYGEYLDRVRYEDPHEIELDHDFIAEAISKTVGMKGRKPPRKTLESMKQFAEGYINGFMWTVNPVLSNGKFSLMGRGDGLGDIYAYWAERIANGKAIACPTCGKLVANARKNQQFCSKSCGVRDYKKRPK